MKSAEKKGYIGNGKRREACTMPFNSGGGAGEKIGN